MKIARRADGSHAIELDAWDEFRRAWQDAPADDRVLIEDPGMRRPAVRRPAAPDALVPGPTYVTVAPALWAYVRTKVRAQAMWSAGVPRKRERLCAACGAALTLAREVAGAWVFRCEVCRSVETWGKDHVGGTPGAGDRETTARVPGADLTP